MKNLDDIKLKLSNFASRFINYFEKHRATILFLLIGISIGYVSYNSQQYLSPTPNQDTYNQKISEVKVKTIDYDFVNKLQQSIDDQEIDITNDSGSGRSNPFNE